MFLLTLLFSGFLVSIGVSPDPEGVGGTLPDIRIRDPQHKDLNLPSNAFPYTPGCMLIFYLFILIYFFQKIFYIFFLLSIVNC